MTKNWGCAFEERYSVCRVLICFVEPSMVLDCPVILHEVYHGVPRTGKTYYEDVLDGGRCQWSWQCVGICHTNDNGSMVRRSSSHALARWYDYEELLSFLIVFTPLHPWPFPQGAVLFCVWQPEFKMYTMSNFASVTSQPLCFLLIFVFLRLLILSFSFSIFLYPLCCPAPFLSCACQLLFNCLYVFPRLRFFMEFQKKKLWSLFSGVTSHCALLMFELFS